MELLTGKAKEEFAKWLKRQNDLSIGFNIPNAMGGIVYHLNSNSELMPKRILIPLIIDFFDSVGIYINPAGLVLSKSFIMDVSFHTNCEHYEDFFKTRQEAAIAGIKKANEIFNSKF